MNKFKLNFWIKEYFLRIKHASAIVNQTRYNPEVDKLLNECLDSPNKVNIGSYIVTFVHPSGAVCKFWIKNKFYAFGQLVRLNGIDESDDGNNSGVYYTTRYRLNKFIKSRCNNL